MFFKQESNLRIKREKAYKKCRLLLKFVVIFKNISNTNRQCTLIKLLANYTLVLIYLFG